MIDPVRHVLTIFAVRNVKETAQFYTRAFGWTPAVEVPNYVELLIPGGMRLGVYERESFAANTGEIPTGPPRNSLGATELYLHTDDLEGTFARALAAGGRSLSPPSRRAWGEEVGYLADPLGNVIAIGRPMGRRS